MAENIPCVLRGDGDWFTIERKDHDGTTGLQRTTYGLAFYSSSRLGRGDLNCDIEGNAEEMLEIASAIESNSDVDFRRAAVEQRPDGVALTSPRNMSGWVVITKENAAELAADIRIKIAAKRSEENRKVLP